MEKVTAEKLINEQVDKRILLINQLGELEKDEAYKAKKKKEKDLKDSLKAVDAAIETAVLDNAHVLDEKGQLMHKSVRVRKVKKQDYEIPQGANYKELLERFPMVLTIKKNNTGIKLVAQVPDNKEAIEQLGVQFKELEVVKIDMPK